MNIRKPLALWLAAVLLLASLSVGMVSVADTTSYVAADVGSYKVVTEVPTGSLITGQTPKGWIYDNTADWQVSSGSDVALMTDGKLDSDGTDVTTFGLWGAGQSAGDWRYFTFDLGENGATVQEFLLGSACESYLREVWVKVYAPTAPGTPASNLIAEKKGMAADEPNIMLKADQAVTTRYISFGLYAPAGCAWGNDTEGYGVGPWYDARRIGEMAVYAAEGSGEEDGGGQEETELTSIVCIGDSITEGIHSTGTYENTYPKQLAALLNADKTAYKVTNLGKGGAHLIDNRMLVTDPSAASDASWNNPGIR